MSNVGAVGRVMCKGRGHEAGGGGRDCKKCIDRGVTFLECNSPVGGWGWGEAEARVDRAGIAYPLPSLVPSPHELTNKVKTLPSTSSGMRSVTSATVILVQKCGVSKTQLPEIRQKGFHNVKIFMNYF